MIATVPAIRLARSTSDSTAHATAGGPELHDAEGNGMRLEADADLAVFEGPVEVNDASWYRVYVLPNMNRGPTEFFSWIPEEAIAFGEPVECPAGRGIALLGSLDPFTRARCVGPASFALRGWTWARELGTWYGITPAWLGEQNGPVDSTISLHQDREHRLAGNPGGGGPFPFVEVQLPPGLERPPSEFGVDLTVHFGDAGSAGCVRRADQFASVPDDVPGDGAVWCATRLVVEQWTPVLGPEERPLDPTAPQLHRHPDRGQNLGCAGVGMPPLVFRMDPTQLDPIWLEAVDPNGLGGNLRSIPDFDPGFRAVFAPDLAVVDERGLVVARNGTPVDPDGQLAGHFICPTGSAVYFD